MCDNEMVRITYTRPPSIVSHSSVPRLSSNPTQRSWQLALDRRCGSLRDRFRSKTNRRCSRLRVAQVDQKGLQWLDYPQEFLLRFVTVDPCPEGLYQETGSERHRYCWAWDQTDLVCSQHDWHEVEESNRERSV